MAPEDTGETKLEDQEISFRVVGDATLVDLPPIVRRAVAEKLGSILAFILRSRPPRLLLDFTRVRRIESAGIAACLFAHRESQELSIRLGIIGITPPIMRLFTIARIDAFFEFFESEEKALSEP